MLMISRNVDMIVRRSHPAAGVLAPSRRDRGAAAALAEQEARLTGEANRLNEVLGLAASLKAFSARIAIGLHDATFDQKRQLVELLIDRVVVTGDTVAAVDDRPITRPAPRAGQVVGAEPADEFGVAGVLVPQVQGWGSPWPTPVRPTSPADE
jgi:hypothetical protein